MTAAADRGGVKTLPGFYYCGVEYAGQWRHDKRLMLLLPHGNRPDTRSERQGPLRSRLSRRGGRRDWGSLAQDLRNWSGADCAADGTQQAHQFGDIAGRLKVPDFDHGAHVGALRRKLCAHGPTNSPN